MTLSNPLQGKFRGNHLSINLDKWVLLKTFLQQLKRSFRRFLSLFAVNLPNRTFPIALLTQFFDTKSSATVKLDG